MVAVERDLYYITSWVDLNSVGPISQGELKLAKHNLAVLGLEGDAHLETLVLNLLHTPEGRDVVGEGGRVVAGKNLGRVRRACPWWSSRQTARPDVQRTPPGSQRRSPARGQSLY